MDTDKGAVQRLIADKDLLRWLLAEQAHIAERRTALATRAVHIAALRLKERNAARLALIEEREVTQEIRAERDEARRVVKEDVSALKDAKQSLLDLWDRADRRERERDHARAEVAKLRQEIEDRSRAWDTLNASLAEKSHNYMLAISAKKKAERELAAFVEASLGECDYTSDGESSGCEPDEYDRAKANIREMHRVLLVRMERLFQAEDRETLLKWLLAEAVWQRDIARSRCSNCPTTHTYTGNCRYEVVSFAEIEIGTEVA